MSSDRAYEVVEKPGCNLCGASLRREYGYMLLTRRWHDLVKRGQNRGIAVRRSHLLCIACAERCLGRQLNNLDFDWSIPLNTSSDYLRSQRLLRRMTALPTRNAAP